MKKVIKSRALLNSKALSNGGVITDKAGKKFNASGKKSTVVKNAAPKKKAAEPNHALIITEAVEKQTSELKQVIESLKDQMNAIKLDYPEPITAWDFEFIRNSDGSLKYIQARTLDTAISRVIN